MTTEVRKCSCKNIFQDQEYGSGMRVCNYDDKGGSTCTVCGVTHKGHLEVKKTTKK